MKLERIVVALLCLSTFFACNKEIGSDIMPVVTEDSNYISKIHYDSLNIATHKYDTVGSTEFSYDAQKGHKCRLPL